MNGQSLSKPIKFLVAVVGTVGVGILSALVLTSEARLWFALLTKPAYFPSDAVLILMWIVLYVLMSIAAYLIWVQGSERADVRAALKYYVGQLLAVFFWTLLLFGFRHLLAGLVLSVLLWLFVSSNVGTFFRVSKPAAALLIPFWLWSAFIAYLSYGLLMLNGGL